MSNHHCNNLKTGGSNHRDNIKNLDHEKIHVPIHKLFGNHLPHVCLLLLIRWVGSPLRDDVKEKLIQILTKDPETLYKRHTIRNFNKFRKQIKDTKKMVDRITSI